MIIEVGGRSLLAGHSGDKLNVEIYTYVSDDKGEMKDFFSQLVALDLAKARQAMTSTGLKYYGHLDLRARPATGCGCWCATPRPGAPGSSRRR